MKILECFHCGQGYRAADTHKPGDDLDVDDCVEPLAGAAMTGEPLWVCRHSDCREGAEEKINRMRRHAAAMVAGASLLDSVSNRWIRMMEDLITRMVEVHAESMDPEEELVLEAEAISRFLEVLDRLLGTRYRSTEPNAVELQNFQAIGERLDFVDAQQNALKNATDKTLN